MDRVPVCVASFTALLRLPSEPGESLTTLTIRFVQDNFNLNKQVINVSSQVGYMVFGIGTVYSATKFYVSAFTEGLDKQLQEEGSKMRAKVLAPGATKTEFFKVAIEKTPGDISNKIEDGSENSEG